MRYTCEVCRRELVTRRDEQTWPLTHPARVPYAAVLKAEGEQESAPAYACAECVHEHDGAGAFEGLHGSELGKLLILDAWSGDGSYEDDHMASDGWGYCARIGRYLYMHDTQGFRSFQEHATVALADAEFTRLYLDGWGACEDDAYITDDRDGYAVSFEGKYLGTFPRYNRARAAISLAMRKGGFFPSVWHCTERGGITNVEVW